MPLPSLSQWKHWSSVLPGGREELGRIIEAGCWAHERQTAHHPPRSMRKRFSLIYLVQGMGSYRDGNGHHRRMTPGDWILLLPRLPHSYGPETPARWHNVYITFEGPIFDTWHAGGFFDPHQPSGRWLPPAQGLKKFNELLAVFERPGSSQLEAVCALQCLLVDILGGTLPPSSRQPPWLKHALALLEKPGPASERRIREIAAASGIGYESFRVKFREFVGEPPARYALARRIAQARQLLTTQSLANKELADLLGFSDEFHFSRTFSRFAGVSPRTFRQQALQSHG